MKRYGKKIVSGLLLILVIAAISLLAFMGKTVGSLRTKLDEMTAQLLYLQDTTNVIQSNLGSMETNLEAAMEEEASLIEDYLIQVKDWDFSKGTYTVDIMILPKEYTDATQTSVYFGTKGYLLELQGYLYKGSVTLSMDSNYDGNVTILFTNGDKKATEVLHNYEGFQTNVKKAISAELVEITDSYKNGIWNFNSIVDYDLDGRGIFEFESLHLVAAVGGTSVYDYDLIHESGGIIETEESTEESEVQGEEFSIAMNEEQRENESNETEPESGEGELTEAAESKEEGGDNEDPADEDGTQNEETTDLEVDTPEEVEPEYVSGLNGTHAMSFSCEIAETEEMQIYLYAVTKEGYVLRLTIFAGMLENDDMQRLENISTFHKRISLSDKKNEEWTFAL